MNQTTRYYVFGVAILLIAANMVVGEYQYHESFIINDQAAAVTQHAAFLDTREAVLAKSIAEYKNREDIFDKSVTSFADEMTTWRNAKILAENRFQTREHLLSSLEATAKLAYAMDIDAANKIDAQWKIINDRKADLDKREAIICTGRPVAPIRPNPHSQMEPPGTWSNPDSNQVSKPYTPGPNIVPSDTSPVEGHIVIIPDLFGSR